MADAPFVWDKIGKYKAESTFPAPATPAAIPVCRRTPWLGELAPLASWAT